MRARKEGALRNPASDVLIVVNDKSSEIWYDELYISGSGLKIYIKTFSLVRNDNLVPLSARL